MDRVRSLVVASFSILFASLLFGQSLVTHAVAAAPTCNGLTATVYVSDGLIVGGPSDGQVYAGTLTGTIGDDVIMGTDSSDIINASIGNDTVCAGGGDDDINGDSGDDTIFGGEGNDTLDGSIDNDTLCGEGGSDEIDGGIGTDTICGGEGDDTITGGLDNDAIDGGAGVDSIDAELGTDICRNGESLTDCEDTTMSVVCPAGGSSSSASSSSTSSGGSSSSSSTTSSSSSSSSGTGGSSSSSTVGNSNAVDAARDAAEAARRGNPSQGAHRGSDTRVLMAAVHATVALSDGWDSLSRFALAPGAFGGGPTTSYALSTLPADAFGGSGRVNADERTVICKARMVLGMHVDRLEAQSFVAAMLRNLLSVDYGTALAMLRDAQTCDGETRTRVSKYGHENVVAEAPRETRVSMAVDESGVPLSSNPIWNACIRNTIVIDETSGRPYNCSRYHNGVSWMHPDLHNVYFTWNSRDPRGLQLPLNYTIVTIFTNEVENVLVAAEHANRVSN